MNVCDIDVWILTDGMLYVCLCVGDIRMESAAEAEMKAEMKATQNILLKKLLATPKPADGSADVFCEVCHLIYKAGLDLCAET